MLSSCKTGVLHSRSARGAGGGVVRDGAGIKWVIVRPHPTAEALHGRVEGLVDWEVVDMPGVATVAMTTMAMPTTTVTSVAMTSISSMIMTFISSMS